MMSQYREQYEKWMSFSGMTDDLKKELEEIKGDDNAVKERFFKPLEFGTAGLRGVIGRMVRFHSNVHRVRTGKKRDNDMVYRCSGTSVRRSGISDRGKC